MTVILGLYLGHDSAFSIVKDGVVGRVYETSRTTQRKHYAGFHGATLRALLRDSGLKFTDVDILAIGGAANTKLAESDWPEVSDPIEKNLELHKPHLLNLTPSGDPMSHLRYFVTVIEGRAYPTFAVHHHVSHTAGAFFQSPFTEARVISWDGGGDGAYSVSFRGSKGRITDVTYNPPHEVVEFSIGGVWTELGRLYPFGGVDYEGKIMGHASYGTPRPEFETRIRDFMEHCLTRRTERDIRFDDVLLEDSTSQESKDFSASLQAATENAMLDVLDKYAVPGEPLVLTGGCSYNCVANGKIAEKWPQTFVACCPHDGGLSLGAALYVWHEVLGNPFLGRPNFSPYLGYGPSQSRAPAEVADQVVDDLLAGKVVAWFDGQAEHGNRALGHRSLLVDPRRTDAQEFINQKVKRREWFRPFAPSVLEGHTEWATQPVPDSIYMSFTSPVREDWAEKIPAVVHVDGTCRPQIVRRSMNETYWQIIDRFRQATGIPMVLNTSFNVRTPIADTEEHAREAFTGTEIDVLYLHGEKIEKTRPKPLPCRTPEMFDYEFTYLRVLHDPFWKKWPETEDFDYTPITEASTSRVVDGFTPTLPRSGGRRSSPPTPLRIKLTEKVYPIYHAYAKAGCRDIPGDRHPLDINNFDPPPQEVLEQMVRDLEHFGKGCQAVIWNYAVQCFPFVTQHLKRIFNFSTLLFRDDCPGSSEHKTWMVAGDFNLVQHQMYVWNYETGQLTSDEYEARGTEYTQCISPPGTSLGIEPYIAKEGFDAGAKVQSILDGTVPTGLVYVGNSGYPNPIRREFIAQLNKRSEELEPLGLTSKLWGKGMRDGVLGERLSLAGDGSYFAEEYVNALFTINYPVSSVFNARLLDSWRLGVIQLIPDRHDELPAFGFKNGTHFIKFDGTFKGFIETLWEWKDQKGRLANIARAGFLAHDQHLKASTEDQFFFDHALRIRK